MNHWAVESLRKDTTKKESGARTVHKNHNCF